MTQPIDVAYVEIVPLTTLDAEKKVIDVAFELEKKPGGQIRF